MLSLNVSVCSVDLASFLSYKDFWKFSLAASLSNSLSLSLVSLRRFTLFSSSPFTKYCVLLLSASWLFEFSLALVFASGSFASLCLSFAQDFLSLSFVCFHAKYSSLYAKIGITNTDISSIVAGTCCVCWGSFALLELPSWPSLPFSIGTLRIMHGL